MKLVFLIFGIILVGFSLLAQPTLTQQPGNQIVSAGGTLSLSVTATGAVPLTYHWFKDGRPLLGATNSILIVSNANLMNSGSYAVVVTNGSGMMISLPAAVAVGNPSLLAWGNGSLGQLGNGTNNNTNQPITVMGNVTTGAAGGNHSLFLTADGKLWSTGLNQYGQLGNGTSTNTSITPTTSNTSIPNLMASNVVAVAAGNVHSLFVKTNGTLWAMGNNRYGQLGTSPTNLINATPVSVATNVALVAAGEYHSLFVKRDGTLWAMGNNQFGQFGNGSMNNTNPVPVSVASNVVMVAAGTYHSLFVTANGILWGMGDNQFGQLGNGTTNNASLPVSVASNVVAVAAGNGHSLFVTAGGTLWAMGYNQDGELGNGVTNNSDLPVSVASNVVAVAAGLYHSLFVTTDGGIWAMGRNFYGQLGNGTTSNTSQPVNLSHFSVANVFPAETASHSLAIGINYNAVVALSNLVHTFTGTAFNATASTIPAGLTVNLTYNGSVVAPANPGHYTVIGTVNDPNYVGSVTNTLVISPVGPTSRVVAAGGTVTLSVTAGSDPSQAYQWFKDGRLVIGATNSTMTILNAALTNSGSYYVLTTNMNGLFLSVPASLAVGNSTLLAWGNNSDGQLGNGTTTNASLPLTVASNVVMGAAGGLYSLFVKTNGTLWAVGANGAGQLGNGYYFSYSSILTSVASNVVAVAAGAVHSLFVQTNGTLWAMGSNQYGQLGIGPMSATNLPACVASNVVMVAAGEYHSLFVKTDGTLWAMGYNGFGQLGNGVTSNTNLPVSVASNVVSVAAGNNHSLFVEADGTLWAMGENQFGQLGNGTTSTTNLPVCVASNVIAVAAGAFHSLFVKTDGTLWAMGGNQFGQLGNGTASATNLPVSVARNVVSVAAGSFHSLFITADGATWAMGSNLYGQLGNGTTGNTNLPVNLIHFSAASIFPADQASHSLAIGIITQAVASVTFGSLIRPFTGAAINATTTTLPPGLLVNLTYNGSATAPTNPGSYAVVARINDLNYQGGAASTLVILPLQPASQMVPAGGTVRLDVTLASDPPLSYQWFKDSRRLLGATNSVLTISNASVTDSGTYYVVETNARMLRISLPGSVSVDNPTLLAWGMNSYGELGEGTTSNRDMPVTVAGNVVTAAAGSGHSLFVTSDGTLWAMGRGGFGELGNGTFTTGQATPVSVTNNVVAVAAGSGHSLFVKNDGTLWSMGWDASYQLGDGDTARNDQPSPVLVASNVMAVAAGFIYSSFLTTDGNLWIVGNGTVITPVIEASNVVAVAGGQATSLYITTDGTLWTAPSVPVIGGSNVLAAVSGAGQSLFVTMDGTLWAMGANGSGQLGIGTTNNSVAPVSVASNVVALAAGPAESLFVTTNGTLYAMGDNTYGELGNGTNSNYYASPIIVPHLSVARVFASVGGFSEGYQTLAIGLNHTANSIDLFDGVPSLTFVGVPGANYNVKRSTDLINWSVIWTTNEPGNGIFQFSDPAAPQQKAYYRLQSNP